MEPGVQGLQILLAELLVSAGRGLVGEDGPDEARPQDDFVSTVPATLTLAARHHCEVIRMLAALNCVEETHVM